MTEQPKSSAGWRMAAAITLGIFTLGLLIVALLVLTGIIAEPETVINNIGQALFGK